MNGAAKGIAVNSAGNNVHVRVLGRGTFQNGQPLSSYAIDMMARGCDNFYVDLGQCQGMDSTFLGVLAGIGLRLERSGHPGKIHVINVNARNMELLQTLGLDRLFDVNLSGRDHTSHSLPTDTDFQLLADTDITEPGKRLNKHDTADFMLQAHDNLVKADPRNAPKFQDLTKFLRDKITDHPHNQPPKT